MPQNLGYLFAAFAVTWLGLFGYLWVIQRMLSDTDRRLRALEDEARERLDSSAGEL